MYYSGMVTKQEHSFAPLLRSAGLKVTRPRVAILSVFQEKIHTPMSVEDIVAKANLSKIDPVTVYRTLASFERAGIVKRADLRKDAVYYEMADHHHHHLVCTDCGVIEDFEQCDIQTLSKKIVKNSSKFALINDHAFELFGLCKSCVKR